MTIVQDDVSGLIAVGCFRLEIQPLPTLAFESSFVFRELKQPFLTRRFSFYLFTLSFQAGAINLIAFLYAGRFITHVTGLIAHAGLDLVLRDDVLFNSLIFLFIVFVVGAMISAAVVEHKDEAQARQIPRYDWLMGLLFFIFLSVYVWATFGGFGSFNRSFQGYGDLWFLTPLALASGLQNAIFSIRRGIAIRTTHLTGTATDLATSLVRVIKLDKSDEQRKSEVRLIFLRILSIAFFLVGSMFGGVLTIRYGFQALLLPVFTSALIFGFTRFWFWRKMRHVHAAPMHSKPGSAH